MGVVYGLAGGELGLAVGAGSGVGVAAAVIDVGCAKRQDGGWLAVGTDASSSLICGRTHTA
jgi:hypothetical protein